MEMGTVIPAFLVNEIRARPGGTSSQIEHVGAGTGHLPRAGGDVGDGGTGGAVERIVGDIQNTHNDRAPVFNKVAS